MSGKIVALLVTLETPVSEEQAQRAVNLMKSVKGVSSVSPVPDDLDKAVARSMAAVEIRREIMEILYPE